MSASNGMKVLAFDGSGRSGSLNGKLIDVAVGMARGMGAEVERVDLTSFELPIYNGDLEAAEGLPAGAISLKDMMRGADVLLVGCPEYNSSITPLLKNAIDWASRPREGEPPLACFRGKAVGLLSASPGALGGLRGLVTVRSIFGNIGAFVAPTQFALGAAHEAFHDDGSLKDDGQRGRVEAVVAEAVGLASGLKGANS